MNPIVHRSISKSFRIKITYKYILLLPQFHFVVNFQRKSHSCKYPIVYHNIPKSFSIKATYKYRLLSPQFHFLLYTNQHNYLIHIGIALYLQHMTNLQFRNLNSEFGDAILCCRRCFDLIDVALSFELSPNCLSISDGYP